MTDSMFDSMIHDLLSRHDPRQTNLPIKLADYESWQKLYTFDALHKVFAITLTFKIIEFTMNEIGCDVTHS